MAHEQSTQRGVDLWCQIAQLLNNIVVHNGAIDINNKTIWDSWLHQRTDQDWWDILSTFGWFNEQQGNLVSLTEYRVWSEAVDQFQQYQGVVDGDAPGRSCMDYKRGKISTKGKTWNMIMVLREVYCRACGIDLPNRKELLCR